MERHFLGWDAPIVRKVRAFLIPDTPQGPVDLRSILVLVPTQQAGRRLRQALTVFCADAGTYLLAPSIRTPLGLLDDTSGTPVASPLDVAAVWTKVLRGLDTSQFRGIFSSGTPVQDFRWALATGAMLQALREELSEHGHSVGSVATAFRDRLEELARWSDAARLEALFLATMEGTFGLSDPCQNLLRSARNAKLNERFERVVLACTPDPTPIVLEALNSLSTDCDIDVLVHAPPGMADSFDAWGRPCTIRWKDEYVDVPGDAANLRLASSPAAQGRLATRIIAEDTHGLGDIALGAPDSAVVPYLEAALAEHDIPTYDPRGSRLSHHPLFRLLRDWQQISAGRSYAALSALLRNSDILDHLRRRYGIPTAPLLTELDEFQNAHLPETADSVLNRLLARREDTGHPDFPVLAEALRLLQPLLDGPQGNAVEASLRTLLQTVYSTRELSPDVREDHEFRMVATRIDESLRLLSTGCVPSLGLAQDDSIELLLQHLGHGLCALERLPGAVDLEGWIELHWNDAPLLIVTGMNEGSVPQRYGNEAFLPDSLRQALGLRSGDDQLARDIYLARTLVESRRATGRICFILGKTGDDGEPLRPSRILLRCSNEELTDRAERLFGTPDDIRQSVPSSITFTLVPSRPMQRDPSLRLPTRLAVTALSDYLQCPFRFYLKHVLRMEERADTKREMDALDFGNLVHEVLARMAASEEMRTCSDGSRLRTFLDRQVEACARDRFGPNPPMRLSLQLDVVRERLGAAARQQAEEVARGWELIRWEQDLDMTMDGFRLRGRVDRIDRHRDSGAIRILDYKTSDTETSPEQSHLAALRDGTPEYALVAAAGKTRRWIDLQLPLYIRMLGPDFSRDASIEAGYFNLPRQTDSTGVVVWRELSRALLESAERCAAGIIAAIHSRQFWPATSRVQYDDFERLFPAGIERSVDVESFARYMQTRSGQ